MNETLAGMQCSGDSSTSHQIPRRLIFQAPFISRCQWVDENTDNDNEINSHPEDEAYETLTGMRNSGDSSTSHQIPRRLNFDI